MDPKAAGSVLTSQAAPVQAPYAVRLDRVNKRFTAAGAPVLQEISLDVAPGEFVCLLGASGCGKSTLLNLIADLDQPTSGTVSTGGERPSLMFQEHALFPWLTAGGNIELALRLRKFPRSGRREEALRLLALVRLEDHLDSRVHELSGGMRQRVALARSLAQGSRVLLMDEPFAALDAITRDLLHEELVRLWQETGVAVVFVTHNVREAARLAQRIILLSSRPGRIIQEWQIDVPQPRRLEDPAVTAVTTEVTAALRGEISRHAQ